MNDEAHTAAPEKKKAPPKVTAFVLDGSVVGHVDAHPFAFGGFPGLWQVGRPTLASALGLTDARMRDLIDKFNLPLVEVKVNEKDAYETFPEDPNRIQAGAQEFEKPQRQPEMLAVNGTFTPGPVLPGAHPDLQPFAAEQIAADTKRLHPDEAESVAVEDETEGDAG